MKRSIVKLKFLAPLHIGNRNLSDSQYEIKSDTIFSALCLESGNIPRLVEQVKERTLKISNAFPYIQDYYYVPKPMLHIVYQVDNYRLFKKIKYIEKDALGAFLVGTLYPEDEIKGFILGDSSVRTQVKVGKDPYQVGVFNFKNNAGLYIIIEHEDDFIFEIFERLQYSGVGGKRSSGLGRFTFQTEKCFKFPTGRKKILLNTAMAKEEELKNALEGANYLLEKRSGFIHHSRYKKRDFYAFKIGSVFENEFEGDLFDVGNDEHPVYRYAVPMFMGVDL